MSNLIGLQLGRYRIEGYLNDDGLGTNYKAYDLQATKPVTLRVIHTQISKQLKFQSRFQQEMVAISRLDHPNLAKILDFGIDANYCYYATPFMEGPTLDDCIKRAISKDEKLWVPGVLLIAIQVATLLGYAHRQGLIHRDLQPRNIQLITEPSTVPIQVIVNNLGLSKLFEGLIDAETGIFTSIGTFVYMSPEQCLGETLSGQSDIYSLGVALYQMVTDYLPFDIRTPTDAVMKHLNEIPPDPSIYRPELPGIVSAIIMKSLAKNPADRYQQAESMADVLGQAYTKLTGEREPHLAWKDFRLATLFYSTTHENIPNLLGIDQYERKTLHERIIITSKEVSIRNVTLDKSIITIGRTPDNDIVLNAPEVSRHHVRLERKKNGWEVTDLGSTKGTKLENNGLIPHLPETWRMNQSLQIGAYYLELKPEGLKPEPVKTPMSPEKTKKLGKMTSEEESVDLVSIHDRLTRHFNKGELKMLCFTLNVEYEDLDGLTRQELALDLIEFMNRRNRLRELIETCQKLRPNISWESELEM